VFREGDMAAITMRRVHKAFGQAEVIKGVDLAIQDKEFVVFVGPSGCGKSTLLRLVAGLEDISSGEMRFDGEVVNELAPAERGIAMVFQSYALYPHMSVYDNMAFGLKLAKLGKAGVDERVRKAARILQIEPLLDRKPRQLSGGQRQRVALARCLAMRPRLLLLDEPLANLDVHLRESMLEEFRKLHRTTGATTVYVTHDQSEAMALADRVAVMKDGELQQLDSPRTLYREPATAMVAEFVGRGMVVPAVVRSPCGDGRVRAEILGAPAEIRAPNGVRGAARVCLREEALRIADDDGIEATVVRTVFHGAATTVQVVPDAAPDLRLRLRVEGEAPREGERIGLAVRDGWVLPEASAPDS
jgi:iron(III) transport system ATP-binding protein